MEVYIVLSQWVECSLPRWSKLERAAWRAESKSIRIIKRVSQSKTLALMMAINPLSVESNNFKAVHSPIVNNPLMKESWISWCKTQLQMTALKSALWILKTIVWASIQIPIMPASSSRRLCWSKSLKIARVAQVKTLKFNDNIFSN